MGASTSVGGLTGMDMEDLSLVLWRERELLETLLYKLEVEKLVLASHSTNWLAPAAREVEMVLETIREGEPWHTILMDHHKAFVTYTRELVDVAATNRELLTTSQQPAREVFLGLGEDAAGYSPSGSAVVVEPRHHVLDRSI